MTDFVGAPRNTAPGLLRWWPVAAATALLGAAVLAAYVHSAGGADAGGGDRIVTSPPGTYDPPPGDTGSSDDPTDTFPGPVVTHDGPRSQDLADSFTAAVDGSLANPELSNVSDILQSLQVALAEDGEHTVDGSQYEKVIFRGAESHQIGMTRAPYYAPLDTNILFFKQEVSVETWPDGTQAAIHYDEGQRLQVIFVKGDTVVNIRDSGRAVLDDNSTWLTLDQLRVIAQAMAAQIPAAPSEGS
ncbi:MAG: hypothetical protein GEU28_09315 [Dehalococcoidia bacterium]|nr:hypothetical protein [Dehalococcoidia bacterium]